MFMIVTEEFASKQKFLSLTKYYKKYSTLDILRFLFSRAPKHVGRSLTTMKDKSLLKLKIPLLSSGFDLTLTAIKKFN